MKRTSRDTGKRTAATAPRQTGPTITAPEGLSTETEIPVNGRWRARLRDWLTTPCLLCGGLETAVHGLCTACREELPWQGRSCPRCAIPLPATGSEDTVCGTCQRRPPAFDHALSAFHYAFPIDHLIWALKFHERLAAGRVLGEAMADILAPRITDPPECIVPVPLHPSRLRARGFNQALELVRPLARRLHVPIDARLCRRIRPTESQLGQSRAWRRRNVRQAFAVEAGQRVRHAALVDDVFSTGATLDAAARALRTAGVERVDVWVCARTAMDLGAQPASR